MWMLRAFLRGTDPLAARAYAGKDGFMMIMVMTMLMMMMIVMMMMIILSYQRGWDTCVPTPKMAYFSVFKAFLCLKYLKNYLGLIGSSFYP